jgi:hypothetical protein
MQLHNVRFTLAVAIAAGVTLAGAPAAAKDYGDIDKINAGIHVDADSTAGSLDTVNGGITVGERSVIRSAETVNGGVRLGAHAQADSVETVNGGIDLGSEALVRGDAESVNGGIRLEARARVAGKAANVNGGIELDHAEVGGGISTVNGDIRVGDGSRVEGGILVEKPGGWGNWSWQKSRPPRVVIGAGAVVEGTLRFEREVELYVHESAKIGTVDGAEAKRYSGDKPPLQ